VNRPTSSALLRLTLLLVLAGAVGGCDSPQKRALRELSLAGIEPTGGALLEAVRRRDVPITGALLAAGVHTERADPDGRTPLRIAVDAGDAELATRLIVAKADVNAVSPDGSGVLGAALLAMDPPVISRLLVAGAKVDGVMPGGEKIVPWAFREGRFDLIALLMKHSPDPHMTDSDGNSLLHLAMNAGRRDLVDRLIGLGADPGQINGRGETTLHVAIRNEWFDVIPALIKAGADPNLPGPLGPSPLSQAIVDGDLELIGLLLKNGADPNYHHPSEGSDPASVLSKTPLELAFFHSDRRIFQLFSELHVRFDQAKMDAWLADAIESRDLPLSALLLSRGANASLRCSNGWLPIEISVARNDSGAVKLLADYGSPAGRSLYIAAAKGNLRMTRLLLSMGMNANVSPPPFLDRPLSVAIRNRHDVLASLLVRRGAKSSFRLPEGQTPFHLAVARECPQTVGALLESGADPNMLFEVPAKPQFIRQVRPGIMRWALKMDRNVTPLMVAADTGNTVTAARLIAAGAKKNTWARVSSLWPINFASRRGDVKMMRLILGRDPHREERHIIVNLGEQRATMFDADGNEIFNTKVSTGRKGFATPTGTFVITNKHRDWKSTIYHASMPYFQRLSCSDFGLHAGVVPGYPASHGCIRVPAGNAAKLFSMTQAGDRVMIVP
jgi:ankyrin repeat protein